MAKGGTRKGAGRPYKYGSPTTQVRIPIHRYEEFLAWRDGDMTYAAGQKRMRERAALLAEPLPVTNRIRALPLEEPA